MRPRLPVRTPNIVSKWADRYGAARCIDRKEQTATCAARWRRGMLGRSATSASIARSTDGSSGRDQRPYFSSTARQAGLSSRRRAWKQRSIASSLSITSLQRRTASGRQLRWSSGVPRGVRNGGSGIGGLVLPGNWAWPASPRTPSGSRAARASGPSFPLSFGLAVRLGRPDHVPASMATNRRGRILSGPRPIRRFRPPPSRPACAPARPSRR